MKTVVHNLKSILLLGAVLISLLSNAQSGSSSTAAPELVFRNAVLKSGTLNKQGAVYRFSNVTTGVDAEIKLAKFSRNDIVMRTIDNSSVGWDKAFQPEFGLAGTVAPFQNWYIDFEMTFYEAGQSKKVSLSKADFTALDVDGDGYSISEYANFTNPTTTTFSPTTSLGGQLIQFGSNGESLLNFTCGLDNLLQKVANCGKCNGTGEKSGAECPDCEGSGKIYKSCKHAFDVVENVQGTVINYNNIDTAATQVMVTYSYTNKTTIKFRYGAKSGAFAVNGSGIRLNSLWAKSFSLNPWTALPVNFASFAVTYNRGDANISWQAPHGEELNRFVVQRSTDGRSFADIATVFAGKTSSYAYTDKGVSSSTGVVYYRVVSVDFTNETQQTTVKLIRLAKGELQSLAIATYPNPVVSDMKITFPDNWQGKSVALQLYAANGTIAQSLQFGNAAQTETMSVSSLPKGLYIVKAVCGQETAQQRIVKN